MVEFYANNASDPATTIGEKININGNGTPLRYMYNPTLDGSSHGCWSTTTKNVDVHYSSGVANHFFFDLAEGTGATAYGTSPVCGSAPAGGRHRPRQGREDLVPGAGRRTSPPTPVREHDQPGQHRPGLHPAAAADLYGLCSAEYKAVQAAWTAVNVAGPPTWRSPTTPRCRAPS
jgi:hypothetical protein